MTLASALQRSGVGGKSAQDESSAVSVPIGTADASPAPAPAAGPPRNPQNEGSSGRCSEQIVDDSSEVPGAKSPACSDYIALAAMKGILHPKFHLPILGGQNSGGAKCMPHG